MTDPLAVVVPRRLSTGADPRIVAANRLFDLIVALAEDVGLTPIVTDDPDYPLEGVGGVLLPGGGVGTAAHRRPPCMTSTTSRITWTSR